MRKNIAFLLIILLLVVFLPACQFLPSYKYEQTQKAAEEETKQAEEEAASKATMAFTPELVIPAVVSIDMGDEPVLVTGTIPYTSPFFINMIGEPFVLLEDQAGFVARDEEFVFPLESQTVGPVWEIDDSTLGFSLALPAVPRGTLVDVDNDGEEDTGLMVFAVAFWSNTWGGPFLDEDEGTGWSGAYASTTTDPFRDYEIDGGYLIIWAEDNTQGFPSGFGEDEMLFTEDDPIQTVPAGYSIVDLNSEPFKIYKEPNPEFELVEGGSATNDYSEMSYVDAFDAMFENVSLEYPFTEDKDVDWDALYDKYAPMIEDCRNDYDFYEAIRAFTYEIPDGHIGFTSFNDAARDALYYESGGSFGLLLAELSDGRFIVTDVLPGTTGAAAGIKRGAEIIKWDGRDPVDVLEETVPFFSPYSTPQALRQDQLLFMTRYEPGTTISVTFRNPGGGTQTVNMVAEVEYDSLLAGLYGEEDFMALPIEGKTLEEGIGYIKITTFSDDYHLMALIWDRYIENLIDNDIPGLIIDMRFNGGGNSGMASRFVGYFFDEEITFAQYSSYNHLLGEWEYSEYPSKITPGPLYYDGPIVVLVSPNCVSACEGFTYQFTIGGRATIVGHAGTAGAYGNVGQGQYDLPGDISLQFPMGRTETMDGKLFLEGTGVLPDVVVPVTYDSALGNVDAVLEKAIEILLAEIE